MKQPLQSKLNLKDKPVCGVNEVERTYRHSTDQGIWWLFYQDDLQWREYIIWVG